MNKVILIFLLVTTAVNYVKSQSFMQVNLTPEKAEAIKKTDLCIVLISENPKYLEKLNKKNIDAASKYSKMVNNYNETLKKLLPETLKGFKSISFKTLDEIITMSIADRQKSTFMLLGYNLNVGPTNTDIPDENDKNPRINFHSEKVSEKEIKNYVSEPIFDNKTFYLKWEIYTFNSKKKISSLAYVLNIPHKDLSLADLQFSVDQLKFAFEGKTKPEFNNSLVAKKKLLICKDELNDKLNESEIGTFYTYPYEIATKEVFDKIVTEKKGEYCYLTVTPLNSMPTMMGGFSISYRQIVVDASNGQIVLEIGATAYVQGFSAKYEMVTDNSLTQLKKTVDGTK